MDIVVRHQAKAQAEHHRAGQQPVDLLIVQLEIARDAGRERDGSETTHPVGKCEQSGDNMLSPSEMVPRIERALADLEVFVYPVFGVPGWESLCVSECRD